MKKITEQLIKYGAQDTTQDSLKIQINIKLLGLRLKMIFQFPAIK
jgi:hypothetical protein